MAKKGHRIRMFGNAPEKKPVKKPSPVIAGIAVDMPRILITAGIVTLVTAGVIVGHSIIDSYLAGRGKNAPVDEPESTPVKNSVSGIEKKAVDMPRILIIMGILTLIAAGAIAAYGFIDDYLAGQRAQAVLERMWENTPVSVPTFPKFDTPESVAIEPYPVQQDIPDETVSPNQPDVSASQVASAEPQPEASYDVIGVLSIPKLTLKLPILSNYSDSLLKVSVCRYEGMASDRPERLVIAGHNYQSHFGKLTKLAVGDEVRFIRNAEVEYTYTVSEITEVSMYDHEALNQGDWDITLFTCDSIDQSRRILIRCREV